MDYSALRSPTRTRCTSLRPPLGYGANARIDAARARRCAAPWPRSACRHLSGPAAQSLPVLSRSFSVGPACQSECRHDLPASMRVFCSAAPGRLCLLESYLLKHPANPDKVVIEDLSRRVKQLKERRVAYGIVDTRPLLTGHHNPLIAKDCELLRGVGRLNRELPADLVDRQLSGAQRIQDRDPQRVRQRLEEVGFEIAQLLSHRASAFIDAYYCMCKYSYMYTLCSLLSRAQ